MIKYVKNAEGTINVVECTEQILETITVEQFNAMLEKAKADIKDAENYKQNYVTTKQSYVDVLESAKTELGI